MKVNIKLMIHYLYMHTLIPIELLPYLQCVAIIETKGSLDELVTLHLITCTQSTSNTEHFLRRDLHVC
jgi:hypothetical protein